MFSEKLAADRRIRDCGDKSLDRFVTFGFLAIVAGVGRVVSSLPLAPLHLLGKLPPCSGDGSYNSTT
jgi:hypothetical protein